MARHKVKTPDFENPKKRRERIFAEKRERAMQISSYAFTAVDFICIVIGGFNYGDDLICGSAYMAIAIITLAYLIFYTYAAIKWYRSIFWWDQARGLPYDFNIDDEYHNDKLKMHYFELGFVGIVILCLDIYFFVAAFRCILGLR